jgi:hypothetical protein
MFESLFFGYGANRSKSKIVSILGHEPGKFVGAVLLHFNLGVQKLSDIPEAAQRIMKEVYGNDFKAYSLTPGEGVVIGTLWQISDEDLAKIKEWEMDGLWREIIEVEVMSSGGKIVKAFTEKSKDEFGISEVIDGIIYSEFDFERKEKIPNAEEDAYYTQEQIEKIKKWLDAQAMLGFENRK